MRVSLLIAIFATLSGFGKELKYPVSEISQNLRENAHAVVRVQSTVFQVQNAASATLTDKLAITILDQRGRSSGYFFNSYFGKFSNIMQFKATVYDKHGEEIAKFKKSDLEDRSSYDGFSVYSDSRYQMLKIKYNSYPYTIEYEVVKNYKFMMFYPEWDPQNVENLAVMKSDFTVVLPQDMDLRFKEINLKDGVSTNTEGEFKKYHWSAKNLSAFDGDKVGTLWHELTPRVLTGPNKFTFGGYSGDMSSWKSYGKWLQKLNKELGEVPPETAAEIKALVADAPNKKEVVRRVYKYLQNNTRYVSIQLGIGGWQPFSPEVVNETGYGDCKALTFYTQSMLKSVGIESLYTLVNAGTPIKKVYTDFPSSQFNHAFLCVPMGQDTIWLECTSQTKPFGYLGRFTSDRPVLLITEEGGKMVRTPAMTHDENQQIISAEVKVSADGGAEVMLNTLHKGYFFEGMARYLLPLGIEDRKKWLHNNLDLPSFTINSMDFEQSGDLIPQIAGTLNVTLRRAGSVSGKRMFLQPNLMNKLSDIPQKQEGRQSDMLIQFNKVWCDTITFKIPQEYHLEFMPTAVEIKEEFGNYHFQITDDAGVLKMVRRLELKKGRYAPALYEKYRNFCQQVVKTDKSKVVLKNTT